MKIEVATAIDSGSIGTITALTPKSTAEQQSFSLHQLKKCWADTADKFRQYWPSTNKIDRHNNSSVPRTRVSRNSTPSKKCWACHCRQQEAPATEPIGKPSPIEEVLTLPQDDPSKAQCAQERKPCGIAPTIRKIPLENIISQPAPIEEVLGCLCRQKVPTPRQEARLHQATKCFGCDPVYIQLANLHQAKMCFGCAPESTQEVSTTIKGDSLSPLYNQPQSPLLGTCLGICVASVP